MVCPSLGALTSQAHDRFRCVHSVGPPVSGARIVMNAVVVAAFAFTAAFSPVLAVFIAEFKLPTAGSSPLSITAGPDGNLWSTEFGVNSISGNTIGRITTSGAVTEFTLPSREVAPYVTNNAPIGITVGRTAIFGLLNGVGTESAG